MQYFIVNGRKLFVDHLADFQRIDKSTYTVTRNGTAYEIFGGKHAGGRRGEWYVQTADWDRPIHCNSLMDALRMLDRM